MATSIDEHLIARILGASTIAVVGLSKDPAKPSHDVASYLQSHGYRIVPVNPTIDEVLGEKAYKSLLDLPRELKRQIDVVDIFRRPEDIPPVVEEAIDLHRSHGHPTAVWMQLGIVNEEAAKKARDAGLDIVMDRCMKIEHTRLRVSGVGTN
jgi:predicted CoA-binding protein